MMVNNEIGTIQPIKEIGEIVKKHKGIFFHTDAAQAVGKSASSSLSSFSRLFSPFSLPTVPIDVNALKLDVLSISAHKLYGPKGIGALYVRRKPRVRLEPLINGGGQERGLRSGTVAAPLVVGFGEACRLAKKEMAVRLFFSSFSFLSFLSFFLPFARRVEIAGGRRRRRGRHLPAILLRFEVSTSRRRGFAINFPKWAGRALQLSEVWQCGELMCRGSEPSYTLRLRNGG